MIDATEEPGDAAVELIYQYGGIDGSHHKQWLLDQVVRILCGDDYQDWVDSWNDEGGGEWDTGIAP